MLRVFQRAAMACFVLALISTNARAQYVLSGKVLDGEENQGLVGATVQLVDAAKYTSTDTKGEFRFRNLKAGTYRIKITYVGFSSLEQEVDLQGNEEISLLMEPSALITEEVMVRATRANENTPTTFSTVSRKEIKKQNLGQDMPFLFNWTPSLVSTSDAGAGIGYTGLSIRGSDPSRINVTINGIPVNDSESHGVFWVNMPDLASSIEDVQIQRGVGTSTNGAGAFGATINMQTTMPSQEAFAEINNGVGSFNTRRHNLILNSGMLNDRFAFEGRLSRIQSDGYIDRARTDLNSYFLSGGYYGKKTIVKALVFGGNEVTGQAWYGTPEARLNNDVEGMQEVIINNGYNEQQAENLLNSGRTFNFYIYDNEIDNYSQDHFQLHLSHAFNKEWTANAALHYTYGRGYFEQFRFNDRLSNYGIDPITIGGESISRSDVIRRRWLDNHFYGATYSLQYENNGFQAIWGGAYNEYDGDHFGEVIWARFAGDSDIRDRYYDNFGFKKDFNTYLKANYQLTERLNAFGDMQVRFIDYTTRGVDNDRRFIDVEEDFLFFNPKVGLTYAFNQRNTAYASYSIGNREPVRRDFRDAPEDQPPLAETLRNLEVGYRRGGKNYTLEANYFLMDYKNQLILTGEVNDVGATIRTNVPESYRTGIELVGAWRPLPNLNWVANFTLSRNRIAEFNEVLIDYGADFSEFTEVRNSYENTDIAFSPNRIAGSQLMYEPLENLELAWLSKFVGRQFLDNTSNLARSIDPYWVNDLRLTYSITTSWAKEIGFSFLLNNIFNELYSSNGYTFGYFAGTYEVRENYFYPQAGRNFLTSVRLRF